MGDSAGVQEGTVRSIHGVVLMEITSLLGAIGSIVGLILGEKIADKVLERMEKRGNRK